MLLAEGEDIYAMMQKRVATVYASLEKKNIKEAERDEFLNVTAPTQMHHLERLLGSKPGFTPGMRTIGELYLFAMVYQLCLVHPELLKTPALPNMKAWYDGMMMEPKVKKVLDGTSKYGP